ncbi:MAG: calcium-binding protein [Pseudomonadota bacterium]
MGQVVPFIARMRDSGDWSASERARLEELADRLAAGGIRVEVIFGATDEGDPWCVVTDENGDVLIHVARIDGRFVVHSAIDDAVNENIDLQAALRDRLEATEEAVAPQSATILPFNVSARQGQTFLALLAATAFFYETAGLGGTAEAATPQAAPMPTDEPPPPPPAAQAEAQDREVVAQGAVLTDAGDEAHKLAVAQAPAEDPAPQAAAPSAETAPALAAETLDVSAQTPVEVVAAAAAPATPDQPTVILGTDGDDLLVGSEADERIEGGAGNDTLIGGGGHDTLLGGAGDDRIELTSKVVAVGGEGADTFVIATAPPAGAGKVLFGVILDFFAGEGDRIFTSVGREIRLPERTTNPNEPKTDDTGPTTLGPPMTSGGADFSAQGGNGSFLGGDTSNLTRVDIDVDGDGVMDGYVLVGHRGAPVHFDDDQAITVTGQTLSSLSSVDPFS